MSSVRTGLISLLLLFAANWVVADDPPLQSSLVAYKPRPGSPALVLNDTEGQAVHLRKLKGKVVVVNFWATWCPPCRREFPSMERLRQQVSGKPVEILAVNVGEEIDDIDAFVSTLDVLPQFPILLDRDGRAMEFWPVRGLPTTFIVDKRGRMAYRAVGGREFDHPDVVRIIGLLLRER